MSGEILNGLFKEWNTGSCNSPGLREAGLDAWLLLEYIDWKKPGVLFLHLGTRRVTEETACRYQELIRKRAQNTFRCSI